MLIKSDCLFDNKCVEWKLLDFYGTDEKLNAYPSLYIYGAGMVGKMVLIYLQKKGIGDRVKAFLVSNILKEDERFVEGIEVLSVGERKMTNTDMVILAAKRAIRIEMRENCQQLGILTNLEIDVFDDRTEEYYASIPEAAYPLELKHWYKLSMGEELNLNNPLTFNEKINWMKLYDRDPRKAIYADKFLVRKYIKEKIGEKYLVPLLGVRDRFDDIDFAALPSQFVLKCNHGSGWNLIVKDKTKINFDDAKKKFDCWINTNFAYKAGFELHYRDITPKMIAEKYISEIDRDVLYDYRFYCFNGNPIYVWVDSGSGTSNHKRTIFSIEWKKQDYTVNYPNILPCPSKPDNYTEMLECAKKLSEGFIFVRIDLYSINGKIYFGEMTFTPQSGRANWEKEEINMYYGSLIKLPID